MTTTPQDLLAAVARGIAEGASIDDRRGGRQACILLATALGEPGESMGGPTAAATGAPRVDGAQLIDLATAKMRAFLSELEARNAAPPATPTSSSSTAPAAAAAPPATAPAAPAAPSPASPRPRPPALRIPIIGGYARRRSP